MVSTETTVWLDSLVLGMAVLLLLRLRVVLLFMVTWLVHMRRSTQLQIHFNRHPVNQVRPTPSSQTQLSLCLVLKPLLSHCILLLN